MYPVAMTLLPIRILLIMIGFVFLYTVSKLIYLFRQRDLET